jgi:heme A synthase
MTASQRRFTQFAWGVLAYTVFVILWGAFVRATGAGAGCGSHWPLCNGEVIPRAEHVATLIEFGHRVTSALVGFLIIGLLVWAFRAYPRGSLVRKGAVASLVLVIIEGGIGAALVKLELVAYNVSVARGWVIAAHLLNTFLLLAAVTLTAWFATGGGAPRFRGRGPLGIALGLTIAGMFVLGASGAVTALGDTLAIGGGIDPAEDPIVAALLGLRIYHPLMALIVGVGVAVSAWLGRRQADPVARLLGVGVLGLYLLNLSIGLVNVWLMAPVQLQILHLLVTDLIWIGLVLFAAAALGGSRQIEGVTRGAVGAPAA